MKFTPVLLSLATINADTTLQLNCSEYDSRVCSALQSIRKQVTIKETTSDEVLSNSIPIGRFGLKLQLPMINNYGCWCYGGDSYPGAKDTTGFGPTMDDYDEACKAKHMGYDCIIADAVEENENCKPTQTKYDLTVSPLPSGDYLVECSNSIATDWCKRRVCMVDLRFLARNDKLERDNVPKQYDLYGHPGYHNNEGDFNTTECASPYNKTSSGGSAVGFPKTCCGDYPYRVWFDRDHGHHDKRCCAYVDEAISLEYGFPVQNGAIYSVNTHMCCDNGVQTTRHGNVCI